MNINNRITKLFGIKYPVIQGGMVWASGWRLASAVSNCGGLGLIGSGSMKPELLNEHILKCKEASNNPFGVNIPLMRKDVEELINVCISNNVKIIFTSAGNPKTFTEKLKSNGITVTHVVPSVKFALKAEAAGCDAVVGEGVEAGGHNGADETTTMCLIPQIADAVNIPVIAAGGIADGRGILAAFSLGAEGVQMGTRFAATKESSAHLRYKNKVIEAGDNDTLLAFKKIGLVRMIKNDFAERSKNAEAEGWNKERLKELLGEKREKLGIFDGDELEGVMEAGQSSGLIKNLPSVNELFEQLLSEFDEATEKLENF